MLLSGGVNSTVCAALMNRALGVDRVLAIHIDNGFMRKGESDQVRDSLARLGLDVKGFWFLLTQYMYMNCIRIKRHAFHNTNTKEKYLKNKLRLLILFSVIRASHEFLNGDTLITEKGPDGTNVTRLVWATVRIKDLDKLNFVILAFGG